MAPGTLRKGSLRAGDPQTVDGGAKSRFGLDRRAPVPSAPGSGFRFRGLRLEIREGV